MKMQLLKFLKVTNPSNLSKRSLNSLSIVALFMATMLTSGITVKAQFTATWALLSAPGKTVAVTDVQAASVVAGDMIPGANFSGGTHNNDGFRSQLGTAWPTTPTDESHLDFPLSPVTGFDLTITGLTLTAKTSGSSGANMLQLAYQVNGSGPWTLFGSPVAAPSGGTNNLNFGTLNQTFFAGQTYVIRMYEYAAGSTSASRSLYIKNVVFTGTAAVSGTPPTVTTDAVGSVTYTTAIATGTITDGTIPVQTSGVCWGTDPLPTITGPNLTTNGPTVTGAIGAGTGGSITGLAVNTTYYVRAYVTTIAGTTYGSAIQFSTPLPDYKLTSTTGSLDFGGVSLTTSSVLSYSVSGKLLSPASGSITVTAPAPYLVSISAAGPFTSSITLPYTGSTLPSTTVYVKFTPTAAFQSASGTITLSGGGVIPEEIINETVTGRGKLLDPAVTSNVGNDFWLGFGYHAQMTSTSSSRAQLSVYVSNPSATATAHVVVEMPGLGGGFIPMEQDIAPGGFFEFSGFPLGDGTADNSTNAPDSRLYQTGTSDRAIHVYSSDGTPVSVWLYSYTTQDAAAGSLIFPTNTWNTSYTVQTIGGGANSAGSPNSFFFVVAQEDGTEIEITPTGDILDPSVPIGQIETSGTIIPLVNGKILITLNKGQVFNAISTKVGNFGTDLSGTTVKSTNCKKFAVFAGNGRNGIGSDLCAYSTGGGSDNLIQQMFPKVAWGSKYYTVPTKHMEYNTFRITVDDPATKVWLNDPTKNDANVLTNYNALNKFYEIYTNLPSIIESDKPISVTQFISSESCASNEAIGNNGKGDPEMIILSPAAQAINKVTVFSPTIKNGNGGGSYINVIIPTSGVSSFKLDYDVINNIQPLVDTGSSSFVAGVAFASADALIPIANAFTPFANDATFSWAKFKVNAGEPHTLQSSVPFNAIAYGTAQGESYGFNAGTQVNDLTAPLILNNPYGDSLNSLNNSKPLTTCKGTEVALSATLPFENVPGRPITFSYGNNANIVPSADDVVANPVLANTFEFNGQTFYVYKLAQKHVFNANGDYQINVTYFNPTPSDGCGGQEGSFKTISYVIKVVDGIAPAFDITYNTCISSTVTIDDNSNGLGFNIVTRNWSYDNGSKPLPGGQDIVENPSFVNPVNNTAANVKLIAINSIGCFGELQKPLPTQSKPEIVFTALPVGLCNTPTAAFELTSYVTPANGTFTGNGVELREGKYWFNPAAANVSTTIPNVITYNFTGGNSCAADPKTQNITIGQSVVLQITAVNPLCVSANAVTLTTNNIAGGIVNGPGVTNNQGVYSFNPATAGAGLHTITYTKPGDNCSTPGSIQIQVVALPTVTFNNVFAALCSNANSITLNQGTPSGGVYTGPGVTNNQGVYTFNPAAQGVSTTSANVITYTVTNATGCVNSATNSITVNPIPTVNAGNDLTVNQNESIIIIGTTNAQEAIYSWTPTTGLTSPGNLVTPVQRSDFGEYVYTLTVTANNCSASDDMTLTVKSPLPCLDPMKGFTPNGDGINEKWIVFNDEGCYSRVQVDVYNRWGGLVFHSDNYRNDWTGAFKGNPVPDATYYYIVKAYSSNGRTSTRSGNVTIIR